MEEILGLIQDIVQSNIVAQAFATLCVERTLKLAGSAVAKIVEVGSEGIKNIVDILRTYAANLANGTVKSGSNSLNNGYADLIPIADAIMGMRRGQGQVISIPEQSLMTLLRDFAAQRRMQKIHS